jgi:hypothetical protein
LSGVTITVLNHEWIYGRKARSSSAFGISLDIAQRYEKGGPTVTEALYEALKELEAQVIALQQGEGKGLLGLLS